MTTEHEYTDFNVEPTGLLEYEAVVATARAVAARYPDWRLVVHTADVVGPQLAKHGFRGPPDSIWSICQPAELHAPDDAVRVYFEVGSVYFQLYPGRALDGHDLFERIIPALNVLVERGFRLWRATVADLEAEYAEFYERWSKDDGTAA